MEFWEGSGYIPALTAHSVDAVSPENNDQQMLPARMFLLGNALHMNTCTQTHTHTGAVQAQNDSQSSHIKPGMVSVSDNQSEWARATVPDTPTVPALIP